MYVGLDGDGQLTPGSDYILSCIYVCVRLGSCCVCVCITVALVEQVGVLCMGSRQSVHQTADCDRPYCALNMQSVVQATKHCGLMSLFSLQYILWLTL